MGKQRGAYQQGGEVFFNDLFFGIQMLQESPYIIAVDPECRPGYLELVHKCIKVFYFQGGKAEFVVFKIIIKGGQDPSYPGNLGLRDLPGMCKIEKVLLVDVRQFDLVVWDF